MYANDRIGDCTIAAAGHMIEAWTAAAPGKPVEVSDADGAQTAFDAREDRRPGDAARRAPSSSTCSGTGASSRRRPATASVRSLESRSTTTMLVRTAAWLFGGLYIGLSLPLTAQRPGRLGLDGLADRRRRSPGSWGGHAVDVVRYDADGLTVVTWGRLQQMTWAFWERYCRRGVLHHLDGLPRGRQGAERFRRAGAARGPGTRDRLSALPWRHARGDPRRRRRRADQADARPCPACRGIRRGDGGRRWRGAARGRALCAGPDRARHRDARARRAGRLSSDSTEGPCLARPAPDRA